MSSYGNRSGYENQGGDDPEEFQIVGNGQPSLDDLDNYEGWHHYGPSPMDAGDNNNPRLSAKNSNRVQPFHNHEPVSSKPSWTERKAVIMDEPRESPGVTDSVGSRLTPTQSAAAVFGNKKVKKRAVEVTFCERLCFGGCLGGEEANERLKAEFADDINKTEMNGILLIDKGSVAVFPEHMPEMEDCFYMGIGLAHGAIAVCFIALAVLSFIANCDMRFVFSGVWCSFPVIATTVMSIRVAKRELRKDVKRLIICVSLTFFTSIVFCAIAYLSATVDGVYNAWVDIKDDQMFKMRCIIDMISMVLGPVEAMLCLGHLSSLFSNLSDECTYRCCPRTVFRKYLKREAKRQEVHSARHLQKKKIEMMKLIKDLEEEERYKEKWKKEFDQNQNQKLTQAQAWDERK